MQPAGSHRIWRHWFHCSNVSFSCHWGESHRSVWRWGPGMEQHPNTLSSSLFCKSKDVVRKRERQCIDRNACVCVWLLTLIWPNHWPTCPPFSDGSWPPPLLPLSVWSGASSLGLTPRRTSRALCVRHSGPYLSRRRRMRRWRGINTA